MPYHDKGVIIATKDDDYVDSCDGYKNSYDEKIILTNLHNPL